jgi:hypothetical protein
MGQKPVIRPGAASVSTDGGSVLHLSSPKGSVAWLTASTTPIRAFSSLTSSPPADLYLAQRAVELTPEARHAAAIQATTAAAVSLPATSLRVTGVPDATAQP